MLLFVRSDTCIGNIEVGLGRESCSSGREETVALNFVLWMYCALQNFCAHCCAVYFSAVNNFVCHLRALCSVHK
jgi:hypothetical protein